MALNETVAKHLVEARRELRAQREALDQDLKTLDDMLADYAEPVPQPGAPRIYAEQPNSIRHVGIAPPMREAIVNLLRTENRIMKTDEIVTVLGEQYGWTRASTRSLLAKLGKDGVLGRPRRGYYHHDPAMTAPTDASAPAATGAEEAGESISGSPREEGGTDFDSATSVGRDVPALTPHEDHGHGDHRAAIGGSLIS